MAGLVEGVAVAVGGFALGQGGLGLVVLGGEHEGAGAGEEVGVATEDEAGFGGGGGGSSVIGIEQALGYMVDGGLVVEAAGGEGAVVFMFAVGDPVGQFGAELVDGLLEECLGAGVIGLGGGDEGEVVVDNGEVFVVGAAADEGFGRVEDGAEPSFGGGVVGGGEGRLAEGEAAFGVAAVVGGFAFPDVEVVGVDEQVDGGLEVVVVAKDFGVDFGDAVVVGDGRG